jgi:HK97 gp10 family phage protein
MQIRLIDNSPQVIKALTAAEEEVLWEIGMLVDNEATENAPVDTGRLRNSITHEVEGRYAVIGTPVEYAPHVELGTSKAKAQPFLRPAVEENINEIKKIIENGLKNT